MKTGARGDIVQCNVDRRAFVAAGALCLASLASSGCASREGNRFARSGVIEVVEPDGSGLASGASSGKTSPEELMLPELDELGTFVEGSVIDRGFIVDDVLQHPSLGDIHFSMYVPDSYDGSEPHALYVHCCGWEGWYSAGVGENLINDFVFVGRDMVADMIIVSPQLEDWREASADMTIALTQWALQTYNIDLARVYLSGYSFGGDTISFVMARSPQLYSRVLHMSSRWDGQTAPLVLAEVPLKMVIGDNDAYYDANWARDTYVAIRDGYIAAGKSADEIEELISLDVKTPEYFEWNDDQHGSGNWYFAHDEEIMGWLLKGE